MLQPIEPTERLEAEPSLMDMCLHILGGAIIYQALLVGIILLVTMVVGY